MVTRHHLIGWAAVPDAEVVAICNRSLGKARDRAAEFGIPAVYGDYAAMLDAEKPDAVDIAVAADLHADYVHAAAERGIPVFCQKPLTPEYASSVRLVEEIGSRVPFAVHENWRFRPQYRQAARWIAEGRTGPIRQFSMAACSSGLIPRPGEDLPPALVRQPFMAEMPRFLILELLIHHLDTVRCLVGERLGVAGARTRRVSPLVVGEDMALILLVGDGGAFGTVTGNFSAPGYSPRTQDRLELIGERATILFEDNRLCLREGDGEKTVEFDLDEAYQASYTGAIAHFAEALRAGNPFETDRLDNLETLRLVEEAYAAAAERI